MASEHPPEAAEEHAPLLGAHSRRLGRQQPKASAASSVTTLLNSAVGAGVLSLPYAYRCAGWAGGLVTTFVVAVVEAFTMYVLSRYAEHTGTSTYSSLVRTMLGRKASALMSTVLLVYGYGSAIAYLIICGDCFHPMFSEAFGDVWWARRQPVIAIVSTTFMLPLCFPTSLAAIAGVSALTFYALIVVVGTVMFRSLQIVRGEAYDWDAVQAFNLSTAWFGALPIIVFGFQCHTNVVAVFEELEPEPVLFPSSASLTNLLAAAQQQEQQAEAGASTPGGGASPEPSSGTGATAAEEAALRESGYEQLPCQPAPSPLRGGNGRPGKSQKLLGMTKVVFAAIGITAVFYSLVGMFGFLAFPRSAQSNILNSFSPTDHVMQVARAVVGLIQIAHYPVNHSPARSATRDLLSQLSGRKLRGRRFNVIETLFFFCSTLATALLVTDLGVVFQVVGGVCGAFFIFGAPGALMVQYSYAKHVLSRPGGSEAGGRLLERAAFGAGGRTANSLQGLEGYHYLRSKLFWAGMLLLLLGTGLCAITVFTILHPL